MSKKVICPNCKSENLTYFKEFCITKYYKLDKNNEPTEKCIRLLKEDGLSLPENWECKECGCIFGGTSGISCEYKKEKL